jgi:hypothetical protein
MIARGTRLAGAHMHGRISAWSKDVSLFKREIVEAVIQKFNENEHQQRTWLAVYLDDSP